MTRHWLRRSALGAALITVITACASRSVSQPEEAVAATPLAQRVATSVSPPTPPVNLCGGPFNKQVPALSATLYPQLQGPQSDAAVACLLWQTFVYLNWPALSGSPGQPNTQAPFDSAGPVVWETFKSYDQVFLPNGQSPGAWSDSPPRRSLPQKFRAAAATGQVRVLHQLNKVSRALLTDTLAGDLHETEEVGGGVLVDQQGNLVYFEMLLNEDMFNYIVKNTLYEAGAQNRFAAQTGIRLPTGPNNGYGSSGTIELKSAWKVLSPEELAAKPLRFHTAQAFISGNPSPVTVGLAGLHIYQRISGGQSTSFDQGIWTTFAQVDNAPLNNAPGAGPYSFYNPACTDCTDNTKTTPPSSTQVTQVFAIDSVVANINDYMQALIVSNNPDSPWQFYRMLGVQWPTSSLPIGAPGQTAPLPNGTQSTGTMLNPVLETFLQKPNTSCLGCHVSGHTSKAGGAAGNLAASYSFLLSHAQAAPTKSP